MGASIFVSIKDLETNSLRIHGSIRNLPLALEVEQLLGPWLPGRGQNWNLGPVIKKEVRRGDIEKAINSVRCSLLQDHGISSVASWMVNEISGFQTVLFGDSSDGGHWQVGVSFRHYGLNQIHHQCISFTYPLPFWIHLRNNLRKENAWMPPI